MVFQVIEKFLFKPATPEHFYNKAREFWDKKTYEALNQIVILSFTINNQWLAAKSIIEHFKGFPDDTWKAAAVKNVEAFANRVGKELSHDKGAERYVFKIDKKVQKMEKLEEREDHPNISAIKKANLLIADFNKMLDLLVEISKRLNETIKACEDLKNAISGYTKDSKDGVDRNIAQIDASFAEFLNAKEELRPLLSRLRVNIVEAQPSKS